MSRREDFDNSLWSDPDFLELTAEARLLYIWTWTNPRCGMAGIYRFTPAQAALETGMSVDVICLSFEQLGETRFAFYIDNVLWVRSRVKHLRQKTSQIATAIKNDLRRIADDHPLKAQFIATYSGHDWLKDALSDDGRLSLANPSNGTSPDAADSRSTVLGTGTGKGTGMKGRGVGRGNRPAPIPPSEAAQAGAANRTQKEREFCALFPDVEPAFVMNAVRELNRTGEAASFEAVSALLEDERPEAA